jgi:hypothetical protein
MNAPRSFDVACFDLAEHFLVDEPDLHDKVADLAAHIQDSIELWIECEKNDRRQQEEAS